MVAERERMMDPEAEGDGEHPVDTDNAHLVKGAMQAMGVCFASPAPFRSMLAKPLAPVDTPLGCRWYCNGRRDTVQWR